MEVPEEHNMQEKQSKPQIKKHHNSSSTEQCWVPTCAAELGARVQRRCVVPGRSKGSERVDHVAIDETIPLPVAPQSRAEAGASRSSRGTGARESTQKAQMPPGNGTPRRVELMAHEQCAKPRSVLNGTIAERERERQEQL